MNIGSFFFGFFLSRILFHQILIATAAFQYTYYSVKFPCLFFFSFSSFLLFYLAFLYVLGRTFGLTKLLHPSWDYKSLLSYLPHIKIRDYFEKKQTVSSSNGTWNVNKLTKEHQLNNVSQKSLSLAKTDNVKCGVFGKKPMSECVVEWLTVTLIMYGMHHAF